MKLSADEKADCRRLIDMALEEDIRDGADLTSAAVIPAALDGKANLVTRAAGKLSGLSVVELIVEQRCAASGKIAVHCHMEDGATLAKGDIIAQLDGNMREMLLIERTALNFMQRLSGIASLTAQYVEGAQGCQAKILDTRKTTPGWRLLEKYAVRCGGGHNHRMGLYDGVMIKDNHLAALSHSGQGQATLAEAVQAVRDCHQKTVPLELEVDTLEQLTEALQCGPDIILLDNMPPPVLRQAVEMRNTMTPDILLEASGGINLSTVSAIAATGVDRISVGALTHSVTALDIGLDYQL